MCTSASGILFNLHEANVGRIGDDDGDHGDVLSNHGDESGGDNGCGTDGNGGCDLVVVRRPLSMCPLPGQYWRDNQCRAWGFVPGGAERQAWLCSGMSAAKYKQIFTPVHSIPPWHLRIRAHQI